MKHRIYFEPGELDLIERIQGNLGLRFLDVRREVVNLDGKHDREYIIITTHSKILADQIVDFRNQERDFDFFLREPVVV